MTELPPDTWAPVPMRWRLVRTGDVFLDRSGAPWMTVAAVHDDVVVRVQAAGKTGITNAIKAPDDTVPVLVPLVERASIVLLRTAGVTASVLDRTG